VASSEPTPLRTLLPDLLGRLGQQAGGLPALTALWARVQGRVIAAHSRPTQLHDGVLLVEVGSPTWRGTLEAHEAVLRQRWNSAVRSAPLRRIDLRLGTP
jgi:predicted nucleic acid-binding Zn ribbon protein